MKNNTVNHQPLTGAINPYALAELAMGRSINWSKVADREELLAQALKVPADQLFDASHRTLPFAFAERLLKRQAGEPGRSPVRGLDKLTGVELSRIAPLLEPRRAADNTETTLPGSVWSDPGDFYEEGSEFADPVQGALGDCYFIAALASVVWSRPYVLLHRTRVTGHAQQDFVDRIDFQSNGSTAAIEVTERVPLRTGDHGFIYARSNEPGEIWPCVYEKAYAKWRTSNTTDKPDFQPLNGGDPVAACAELVPGLTASYTATASSTAAALYSLVRSNSVSKRTVNPMVAWTYARGEDSPDQIHYDSASGVVGWHAYSVLGWDSCNGVRYIVLRNPWGTHEGKVDVKQGKWTAHDVTFSRVVPLNQAGVFAMKVETFKKYFAGIGVAK